MSLLSMPFFLLTTILLLTKSIQSKSGAIKDSLIVYQQQHKPFCITDNILPMTPIIQNISLTTPLQFPLPIKSTAYHTLVKFVTNVDKLARLQTTSGSQTLFTQQTSSHYEHIFTTQYYGVYAFCVTGLGVGSSRIEFKLSVGKHADDFGSHLQNQDYISTLRNQAQIASAFLDQIANQNSQGMHQVLGDSKLQNNGNDNIIVVEAKSYLLSILFVVGSIILTVVQFNYVKNYLRNKKYI